MVYTEAPVIAKALKLQDSIVARYLTRRILFLLLAVFAVLSLVILGNQLILVIKESLEHNIPTADLLSIIGFKMLRDIPLILSLSLFLAIILAIGKLYKDSEAVVMNSLGVGDKHFMVFIQPVVLTVVLLVLILSLLAVPWSKGQRSLIMDKVKNASEFSLIKQGEFQEFKGGDLVLYAAQVNNTQGETHQALGSVFIYQEDAQESVIILAETGEKYSDDQGNIYINLSQGKRYHGFPGQQSKKILDFNHYQLQLSADQDDVQSNLSAKIEAQSTWDLLRADASDRTSAELQWRLSQGVSIFILSLLGVLLGKSSPRGGKNLGVLFGVVLFIAYNNALLIAKSSLESGAIPAFVGLWSVHLAMLGLLLLLYAYRHGKLALSVSRT